MDNKVERSAQNSYFLTPSYMRKWYKIWVTLFTPRKWYWPFVGKEQYMVVSLSENPVTAMQEVTRLLTEKFPGKDFRGTDIAEIEQPDSVQIEAERIQKVETDLPAPDYVHASGADILRQAHEKRDALARAPGAPTPGEAAQPEVGTDANQNPPTADKDGVMS